MNTEIRIAFTEYLNKNRIPINLTKPELMEVIEDVIAWANDNKTEYNQSIRQPQRDKLTIKQKYHLLMLTLKIMWESENG